MGTMDKFEERYNKYNKITVWKRFKQWWNKNGYKVMRVLLFYIWIPSLIIDKLKAKNYIKDYNNGEISVDWLKKFCDKYLPGICDKTENGYYFFNNGYGFSGYRFIKRRDRKIASIHRSSLLYYIVDKYEIEGYTKDVIDNGRYDYYEVEFIKNGNE